MRWGRFAAVNHRGAVVPRVLGLALAACGVASTALLDAVGDVGPAGWGMLAGSLLVCAAGLVDDVFPVGPRGLRNHLRSLAQGHMTTGILKLLVIVGSSVVVVALQPRRSPGIELAGAVLLAASANVWNGLDVVPGRALKAFAVVAVAIVVTVPAFALVPAVPGLLVAAVPALALDLRERAMLGDAGANLLGFCAGLGLYACCPSWAVLPAAAVGVGMNVLADTVTLSRVVDGVPPLRWLDRLGRMPDARAG
jgi:hypothetical protein